MNRNRITTGRNGEDEACRYLESIGHTVVERNWRTSHLELDIISTRGRELHIVEVKSRTVPIMAEPQCNVDHRKQVRLLRAAKAYLRSQDKLMKAPEADDVSFDVISVLFDNTETTINYFPQAFIPITFGR